MKVAIVRGKFLNRYEMQQYEPLARRYDCTAFGSLTPFHDSFAFPVVKLPSPMDLPDFPYKMSVLNRVCIDAHYLWGLGSRLKGFDLVHTAETYFRFTQQCLDAKANGSVGKVIATVYENIPFNNEGIWGRKAFKRRAIRELDHIIAISEKAKQSLVIEGADPAKITVIGHSIDTKRFRPAPARRPNQTLRFLFVGRLEAYKGVYDILSALAAIERHPALVHTSVDVTFVGHGSQYRQMLSLERQFSKFWHFRHESATYDHMPAYYRNADLFIAPSKPRIISVRGKPTPTWQEQFNIALLEAQASGLPIVTTDSGSIRENVGDAAVVVPPGDIPALSRAILSFVSHPDKRRAYGAKARKRAVAVHDIARGSARIAALYDTVLSS